MPHKKSLAEIHVAVVLFGIAGLFGKWLVLAPTLIVFGRVFFASLTLALILLATKQSLLFQKKSTYGLLVFLGFLSLIATWLYATIQWPHLRYDRYQTMNWTAYVGFLSLANCVIALPFAFLAHRIGKNDK